MADLSDVKPDYIHRNVVVDSETGCWIWQLKVKDGYGMTGVARGTTWMAHRLSYMVFRGPVAHEFQLDHLCRNRTCVNPDHLEPVTPLVNTRRATTSISQLNRAKTHCHRGHEFTAENTYVNAKGNRSCRACNRDAVARYVARRGRRQP